MKLWVDTETGTWGWDTHLVQIATNNWTDNDWEMFDNMTDNERCAFALSCQEGGETNPVTWFVDNRI